MGTIFPFLHLPAEIRNKIYRYLLVEDPSTGRIRSLAQPPLTRTNKQVRSEALPIYYGENKFLLRSSRTPIATTDPEEWPNFVRMFRMFKAGRIGGRGTGSLRFIRNIRCRSGNAMDFKLYKVPKPNHANERLRDLGDDRDKCAWHDWESVANYVEDFIVDRGFPAFFIHKSSVHQLIGAIVMVASECNGVTKDSDFDTIGKLCF